MKLKKYLIFIFIISIIFIGTNSVLADSFTLSVNGITEYNGISVENKKLGTNTAYCISGMGISASNGTTCNMDNSGLTDAQRSIIGQIIKKGCSTGCSSFGNNYVITEVAIMEYLQDIGKDIVGINETTHPTLASKANELISTAKSSTTINVYKEKDNFEVEFDSGSLTFTKSGDIYKSQQINLTKIPQVDSTDYKLTVTGVSGATIVGNYKSFYVQVPVANVTSNVTITVSTPTIYQKYYQVARKYDCSSGQDVVRLIDARSSGSDSISGTISPKGSLTVNKVDESNQPVIGATITITGPNGYEHTYETDGTTLTLDNLEFGEYVIKEIKAPDGYVIAKEQKITLSSTELSQTVTMKDELTKVSISKLDATGKNELPGATLEIQNEKGEIVKYCKDTSGNIGAECKWVSSDTPYIIEGLPVGKYYLIETIAPKGYVLSKEKIEFIVTDEAKVVRVEMKNELEVEVPNTLSARSALLLTIAMFDIALGIGIVTYVKKNKIEQ